MATLVRLVLVVASVAAALASASPPAQRTLVKPPVQVKPFLREHVVKPEVTLDGIEIAAVPTGATGWTIRVRNNSDEAISILWDESSFVGSSGEATRMLRGNVRRIDTAKSQPNSPVPTNARATTTVYLERFIELEETDAEMTGRFVPVSEERALEKLRDALSDELVGGRLHLVIETSDGKVTWTGKVEPK